MVKEILVYRRTRKIMEEIKKEFPHSWHVEFVDRLWCKELIITSDSYSMPGIESFLNILKIVIKIKSRYSIGVDLSNAKIGSDDELYNFIIKIHLK